MFLCNLFSCSLSGSVCWRRAGESGYYTVKGQKALNAGRYRHLCRIAGSQSLLKWTRPQTLSIDSAALNLEQIVDIIAGNCEDGKQVVRLHTGDPSLYGAIFEQMAALMPENPVCYYSRSNGYFAAAPPWAWNIRFRKFPRP